MDDIGLIVTPLLLLLMISIVNTPVEELRSWLYPEEIFVSVENTSSIKETFVDEFTTYEFKE